MATAGEFFRSSNVNFIKTAEDFEKSVKTSLGWSKKQWTNSGENATRFNKLINSINYWKNKLKPALEDYSIVITVFNMENDVKTELEHIIRSIENLDPNIKVRGFSEFRNPRYLCIYLKDKTERDFVVENFKMIDNNFITYLHWAFETDRNVITIKIHWLPMAFKIDDIKKALDKYVKCIEQERFELTFMSGRNMPSGKVVFKANINEGCSVESIPHLINVRNMEALVTVPGRLPLCLNCDVLGHISKKCKMRYCPTCNDLRNKDHECVLIKEKDSYASKVKGKKESVDRADPDDWDAAIIRKDSTEIDKEKLLISKKIMVLESKINGIDPEDKKEKLSIFEDKPEGDNKNTNVYWPLTTAYEISDSSDAEDEMDLENSTLENLTGSELIDSAVKAPKKKSKKRDIKGEKKSDMVKLSKITSHSKKGSSNEDNLISVRSYGKPIYNNRRRQMDEKKFEKLLQSPEFVFKDQE